MSSGIFSLEVERTYVSRRHEVVRFLTKFGLGTADAEDIAQDAFLRAFQPSAGASRPENLFRWLLACAKNLAINRYRRCRRERYFDNAGWDSWETALSDPKAGVEAQIYYKQLLREVRRALDDRLTPVERSCLVLRSRGSTYRQVADQLEISMDRAIYLTGAAIDKVHREIEGAL